MAARELAMDPTGLSEALQDLSAGFRARMSRAVAVLGLTLNQATALYLVNSRSRITLTELADLMATSVPNANGIVTRLEREGLMKRSRTEDDKRVTLLHVTPAGEETLQHAIAHSRAAVAEMFGGVSSDDIEQLARILGRLREQLH